MYFYYDVLKALSYEILKEQFGDLIDLEPEKPVKANRDLVKMR